MPFSAVAVEIQEGKALGQKKDVFGFWLFHKRSPRVPFITI